MFLTLLRATQLPTWWPSPFRKAKQDEAKAIEDAQAAEAVNAQAQAANADQKAFNNEIKDEL